ncbi:polyprotein [Lichtheimia corymbifera JMRC:FSU:9682]|uniref:Polyprotein n=1 Tax=Lichtheimia corymbifera JMRC:FSU:9682 TaxID=1263082 RepID=A0A068S2Z8_9FUNG|nr:polyprotein [Lichtheimia corymbifera JMRC:FSU:9682]
MGIALLVHPDCPYPVHHIPTTSPYLLSCQIADILIHCVYLPPSASYSNDDAISFIESLPLSTHPSQTNTIICGDFNARIRGLLGDSRSNTRGTALYDFIMHNNITCWNATLAYGQPTYHSFTNEREDTSIIDLFLSTNPLDSPSIAIENDMDLGSDHKPVRLTFTPSSPAPPPQQHPRQLWHLNKLSDPEIHQQYGTHLTTNIQPVLDSLTLAIDNNDTPPDIDALSTMFTDAIHHALDTSIGRKKPGTRDNSNKWFGTMSCKQPLNDVNTAINDYGMLMK